MTCTQTQSMAALEMANAARFKIAQLKRGIKDGTVDPVTVICERDEHIKTFDVLRSIERFGEGTADKILKEAGLDRRKYVDHLTGRQAHSVATQVLGILERRKAKVAA